MSYKTVKISGWTADYYISDFDDKRELKGYHVINTISYINAVMHSYINDTTILINFSKKHLIYYCDSSDKFPERPFVLFGTDKSFSDYNCLILFRLDCLDLVTASFRYMHDGGEIIKHGSIYVVHTIVDPYSEKNESFEKSVVYLDNPSDLGKHKDSIKTINISYFRFIHNPIIKNTNC